MQLRIWNLVMLQRQHRYQCQHYHIQLVLKFKWATHKWANMQVLLMSAFPWLSCSLEVYAILHKYQGKSLEVLNLWRVFAILHKYFSYILQKLYSRNTVYMLKKIWKCIYYNKRGKYYRWLWKVHVPQGLQTSDRQERLIAYLCICTFAHLNFGTIPLLLRHS